MVSLGEVLRHLEYRARRDQLEGMARYGMNVEKRLGVSIPELHKLAKIIGKDHGLARDLWKTGIADAEILAAMIDDSEMLDEKQMEEWVKDVDSWDVGDQVWDERSSVKKAVSWALRNIGKRNLKLNKVAVDEANRIRLLNSKSARWIAADVTRELESEAVQKRLKKKQA